MTDLSDFLLARIAEDEAVADEMHRYGCDVFADDGLGSCDCGRSARVLAECKAKRRIVEQSHVLNRHGPGRVVAPELRWVLASLALPYADHPDYREEWRP